jgi:predicted Fe-Mo cluster-binding NifX family protein
MLNDALVRICRACEHVAVRAVVVHAVGENATMFYERFGLRVLTTTPRTLMVALAALRDADYV